MKNSTTVCLGSKTDVAVFVDDLLWHLKPDCVLTMTIRLEKSGDCFATIVTEEWSEDTAAPEHSSDQPTNI